MYYSAIVLFFFQTWRSLLFLLTHNRTVQKIVKLHNTVNRHRFQWQFLVRRMVSFWQPCREWHGNMGAVYIPMWYHIPSMDARLHQHNFIVSNMKYVYIQVISQCYLCKTVENCIAFYCLECVDETWSDIFSFQWPESLKFESVLS